MLAAAGAALCARRAKGRHEGETETRGSTRGGGGRGNDKEEGGRATRQGGGTHSLSKKSRWSFCVLFFPSSFASVVALTC